MFIAHIFFEDLKRLEVQLPPECDQDEEALFALYLLYKAVRVIMGPHSVLRHWSGFRRSEFYMLLAQGCYMEALWARDPMASSTPRITARAFYQAVRSLIRGTLCLLEAIHGYKHIPEASPEPYTPGPPTRWHQMGLNSSNSDLLVSLLLLEYAHIHVPSDWSPSKRGSFVMALARLLCDCHRYMLQPPENLNPRWLWEVSKPEVTLTLEADTRNL